MEDDNEVVTQDDILIRDHGPGGLVKIGAVDDERLEMLFEWGMPRDAERILVRNSGELFFERRFNDYSVEKLAVHGEVPQHAVYTPGTSTSIGGALYYKGRDGAVKTGLVWLRRITWANTAAVLEEVWHPMLGWQTMIGNLSSVPMYRRIRDLKKLSEGLLLGFNVPLLRRPTQSGNLSNVEIDDLIDIYAYLWAKHQRDGLKAPTQYDLAAYLGVDRTTLWRRFEAYLTWEDLKSKGKTRATTLPLQDLEQALKQS